jgi:hypothetical protein
VEQNHHRRIAKYMFCKCENWKNFGGFYNRKLFSEIIPISKVHLTSAKKIKRHLRTCTRMAILIDEI